MTIITGLDIKFYARITYDQLGFTNESDYEGFLESDTVPAAERMITDFCSLPAGFFEAGGTTITDEYHDSDESGELWLNYHPVVSITSLSINKKGLTEAPSWTSLSEGPGADKHYILYKDQGHILIYQEIPPSGHKNVKATYKTGYSATPASVARVAAELGANILRDMLKRKLSPQEFSEAILQGPYRRETVGQLLSDEMKQVLSHYYLPRVSHG